MREYLTTYLRPLLALILAFMCCCNIFNISGDDEKTPVEKAEDHIKHGRYVQAKQELAQTVKDSVSSEALYFTAKATLLDGGFDIADIVSYIRIQEPVPGLRQALLEFIDQIHDIEKTKWFASNIQVAALLGRIWRGLTVGTFSKDDIAIDYTIANMMTGILKIRDPNGDYKIDFRDFQIDLTFFKRPDGYLRSGFMADGAKIKDASGNIVVNDQGLPVILHGLTAFLGDWGHFVPGVSVNYKPDDINTWLESTLSRFSHTESLIQELERNDTGTSFDIGDLKKYNRQIAMSLNNYWYNDGIDNDGDGRTDEEDINGVDDDNDGLVDEDSRHHPSDETPEKSTRYRPLWQEWIDKLTEGR